MVGSAALSHQAVHIYTNFFGRFVCSVGYFEWRNASMVVPISFLDSFGCVISPVSCRRSWISQMSFLFLI